MILLLRLVLVRKGCKVLELWGSKGRWGAWLEWAAEKQLGWQKGSEVHVEPSARCLKIGAVLVAWSKSTSVDGHVVRALRMPVGVAWLVRGKGTMREAVVSAIDLPLEAGVETRAARGALSAVVLHTEHMRRQTKAVPRVL